MKISVITTTFNSEETIARNVLSVINQTYGNFEQIIIDNESSDNTLGLVKRLYDENGSIVNPKNIEGIDGIFHIDELSKLINEHY